MTSSYFLGAALGLLFGALAGLVIGVYLARRGQMARRNQAVEIAWQRGYHHGFQQGHQQGVERCEAQRASFCLLPTNPF